MQKYNYDGKNSNKKSLLQCTEGFFTEGSALIKFKNLLHLNPKQLFDRHQDALTSPQRRFSVK